MINNQISQAEIPEFDRSLLSKAIFEFVVVSDTHYILDPEPYAEEVKSVLEWCGRAGWALRLVRALQAEFVVHLGDLTEENSSKPRYLEARRLACEQIKHSGLEPYHVPGNMDIGDKPDTTMWTDWVSAKTLPMMFTCSVLRITGEFPMGNQMACVIHDEISFFHIRASIN